VEVVIMTNHPNCTMTYAVGVQHYYNSGRGWELMGEAQGGVERHTLTMSAARAFAAARDTPEGSTVTVYGPDGEPLAEAGRGSKHLAKI
jgi:hypothetical protein